MRKHEMVYALNAGGVDPDAIARVDLEKMRLAGEHPVANVLPMVLGPMTLRPGTEHLTAIPADAATRQLPFDNEEGGQYMLLLSANAMRIGTTGGVIQQVPAVGSAIETGAWSDVSTAPATATGGAALTFAATTTASARLRQAVSISPADQAAVNILRVVVSRGPVFLRVGTTAGGQELQADAELDTGTHKIGVTPGAATIYIEIRADDAVARTVSECQFESTVIGGTGDLVIPTPWSWEQVQALRTWQSIDTVFVGDGEQQQRRIEHHGPLSWGLALYKADDGPFLAGSSRITMTPAALAGNTTLTASEGYFQAGHVGALIETTQTNKVVQQSFTGIGQTSDYVTIVGVSAGRQFHRTGVSSTFVGTIVLERSFEETEPSGWTTYATYTDGGVGFARTAVDDGQNNITAHYRFRCTAYTSGSAAMTLDYESGVQTARARITAVTSATVAEVETIVPFGNTSATRSWRVGAWSDLRGWPRVPVIHDDRMHWFRKDTHYGSLSGDYYVFDDAREGDSAPFTRTVGGPVLWGVSQDRLLVGQQGAESVIAASELDEPLTITKYTVRQPSRRGCADIEPAGHDDGLFFVQRSGRKLYQIGIPEGSSRFRSDDVSRLAPAAYRPGIVRVMVQQQPDTRGYAVLADGTLAILTFERDDKVVAVTTMAIVGARIEDVATLSADDQDDVYLIVNRTGQRSWERIAKEADQRAVATCALLDSHKVLTGSVSSITGAAHLAGQTVQVWADGRRRPDVTLDGSGAASLGATYARVVYGKRYTGVFKSVKLAYAAGLGTAVGQTKIVHGAGVILQQSCLDGIRIGRDADNTDPMPAIVDGAERSTNQLFPHYDGDIFPINSTWDSDARVYVEIDSAEGPCTVQALVLDVETRDGAESGNG